LDNAAASRQLDQLLRLAAQIGYLAALPRSLDLGALAEFAALYAQISDLMAAGETAPEIRRERDRLRELLRDEQRLGRRRASQLRQAERDRDKALACLAWSNGEILRFRQDEAARGLSLPPTLPSSEDG
jgi:hypothetical protein